MNPPLINDLRQISLPVRALPVAVEAYTRYLGYVVRHEGALAEDYAAAIGAPALARAAFSILGPADDTACTIRFIQDSALPEEMPHPLATYGWTALELTVRDCDGLWARLQNSPFHPYSGPADLLFAKGVPGQRACQMVGPHGELLYLTQILRQHTAYKLAVPGPGLDTGRLFIQVLNANGFQTTLDFYTGVLGMPKVLDLQLPLKLVNRELKLDPATTHRLATVRTVAGTMLEIDGYSHSARPRPVLPGHLPSQAAMLSMTTTELDVILERLAACRSEGYPVEIRPWQNASGEKRWVIVKAPGGELLELCED